MTIPLQQFDPTQDYYRGGYLAGFYSNAGVLPVISDTLSANLGWKVYEDMMNDAKVSKCVNVIKTGVVGDGIRLLSPFSDTSPEYNISAKIEDFCAYNLENLVRPFREVVWEMLDALIYGHKVAEITYKIGRYDNKNYMLLASIKPKPFGSTGFVVDEYFNLLGLTATNIFSSGKVDSTRLNPDSFSKEQGQVYLKVDSKKVRFLNRDKFFVLSINSLNNDPRGRSILRAAYTPWNIKNKVHCEYLRYLNTSASPLLIGFTPSESSNQDDILVDNEGKPIKDSLGRVVRINPVQSLRDALTRARDSGVLAMRGGSKIESVGGDGAGIAFYKAIEVYDEQIEMSILLQTLATSESRFQTRSASETHAGTLENVINHYRLLVADAITKDILRPLIIYNFGEQYLKYMPQVSLGDTQRRDFSLDSAAIANLYGTGYLSEDQKRFTDLMLGLPVRDSEYDKNRTVSTEEQLKIREAALTQEKLRREVLKIREESNRLITNQLADLSKILETITNQSIKAKIEGQINILLESLNSTDLPDSLLEDLKSAEALARNVLTISSDKIYDKPDWYEGGNLNLQEGDEVGTNAAFPLPQSYSVGLKGYTKKVKRIL